MTVMNLDYVKLHCGGELHGDASIAFDSVSTDTRTLPEGALFVALVGPQFDGNDFARQAVDAGAKALLVSRFSSDVPADIPQLVVADTLVALQKMASAWRCEFNIPVVGVTGSTGKTTVKQMLGAVLDERGRTLVTHGNLNNEIGVPLTLLKLRESHEFAVIEMGANHVGEIAALAALARPSIGLITNAGEAHLEGFGGIEGVVRGKGEMYAGVQDGGTCIINADQPWQDEWRERAGSRRVITFGQAGAHDFHVVGGIDEADGQLRFSMVTPDGEVQVALPMAGRHNVKNALAAAAAAWSCGCSLAEIQAGLAVARNVSGRMHVEQLADDIELVDDTYNANPLSMRAAAEWLAGRGRPGWLVMGDMGELGPEEQQLHEDVGRFAAEQGVTRFYAVGELSKHAAKGFGADARHFDSVEALIEALTADIKTGITVLVKGSRAARMERVVAALRLGGTA